MSFCKASLASDGGRGPPEAPKAHTLPHVHESGGLKAREPWEAVGRIGHVCSVLPGGTAIQCLTPRAWCGRSSSLPAGRGTARGRFP